MSLKDMTAIVTGAGRDIGRACALRLAAEGANVALSYHSSSDGAESAVAEITKAGGKAIAVQADLNKPADVDSLVKQTVDAFGGGVEILVNNTGGLVAAGTLEQCHVLEYHQHFLDDQGLPSTHEERFHHQSGFTSRP